MKTDYSDLIGTEFTFVYSNGSERQAILVGADYHKGITAVSADNPEVYLICLNKTVHYGDDKLLSPMNYRRYFQTTIKYIKSGKINARSRDHMKNRRPTLTNQNCAFM